jgi:ribosomal protein S26
MERYIRFFGSTTSKANKNKGHLVSIQCGVKGVIVPGDDGLKPWKLQSNVRDQLIQGKVEDLDSKACESNVDERFGVMDEMQQGEYEEACQGMNTDAMAEILADAIADAAKEEGTSQTTRRAGSKQKQGTINEKVSASDRKKRKWSGIVDSDSDDESGEKAKQKNANGGKLEGTMRRPGGSISTTLAARDSAPPRGEVAPETDKKGDGADPKQDGDALGDVQKCLNLKGRPPKDLISAALAQYRKFAEAGDNSMFFGERCLTQQRLLQRWGVNLSSKLINAKESEKESLEVAQKRLQIMDTGIKLCRLWTQRQ